MRRRRLLWIVGLLCSGACLGRTDLDMPHAWGSASGADTGGGDSMPVGDAGPGSFSTPAVVQSANDANTGITSLAVTISPSGAGNLLVVGTTTNKSSCHVSTITDDKGDTYFSADVLASDTRGNGPSEIWYAGDVVAGVTTVTVNVNESCNPNAWIVELSGIEPSSPLLTGATADHEPTTTTDAAPLVAIAPPPAAVVSVVSSENQVTGIAAGNLFAGLPIQNGDDMATYVVTQAGSYGAAWDAESGSYCASTVAFRAARL